MNIKILSTVVVSVVSLLLLELAVADEADFADELLSIQREFDAASFSALAKGSRKDAFADLVAHAAELSERYPARVEAIAWHGIVLSTYAGEVGALGAMKYAKAAREVLLRAESMQPTALDGGIYASLGALYSKVPGGIVGFGDDALAVEYFEKALEVDSENIDNNYLYGEFLIEHGQYEQAMQVLNRALNAPQVGERPLFDAGRREEIRELLRTAKRQLSTTAAR